MADGKQDDLFEVGRKGKRKATLPRRPDRVFDGLLEACGYRFDRLSKVDREILNAAARCLRESGVTNTEAGFTLIQNVAKAYRADRKLCEHMVAGYPSPSSLAKHWHALVRQVKPSPKAVSAATAALACRERLDKENKEWWRKKIAAWQETVAKADQEEVARVWENLKKGKGLPKRATMEQHIGEVADALQARRMEANDAASND